MYCRYLNANLSEIEPPIRTVVFPEFVVYCCGRTQAAYMSVTQAIDEAIVLTAAVEQKTKQSKNIHSFLKLHLTSTYFRHSFSYALLLFTLKHEVPCKDFRVYLRYNQT